MNGDSSTLKGLNQTGIARILTPCPNRSQKFLSIRYSPRKIGRPFLRDKILRDELHHYLGGILTHLDCQPLIVGGVEDHAHLLCTLSRTHNPSEMVKEVKRGSSLWIKAKDADLQDFAWQSGYGMFSIGFSQVDSVRNYIAGQEEHHRQISFQDEFRQLLNRYEVEFDERFVWD